jgi:ABC-type multidrug transport system ATPase subunit
VLESKRAIDDLEYATPLLKTNDGITFDNVTFEYVKDTPVLKNIDLKMEAGKTIAVVGHTGAGKTTLAALINRFYDPQEGNILIGDQDLREITLDSLHGTVALIPQEPYLFDASVMENIRYGRADAKDEEIKELCGLIGANDFIEVLADGYDTCIIENGKNLSAGQRQMITIARTMLANPRILILDEATSRLDAYSESLVQDAQAMLFSDRTTVVIAHRLTTIANASRIIVFEDGEIIEDGTHEELLALNGTFKSLYETYYAHQGFEELTEETARVAGEEVSKIGGESALGSPQPSGGMGMMGMMGGGGPHGMPGGHGGMPRGGMGPPAEMMKKMLENPEDIPPPMRGHLIERLEQSDDPEMQEFLRKLKDLEKKAE